MEMLKDRTTWTAMFYMLLQLPLGIIYFTLAVAGLSMGLGLIFGPIAEVFDRPGGVDIGISPDLPLLVLPLVLALGILVLTLVMHLAKAIGMMHGHLAKALLVRSVG
jgi:hypothetical protein